MGMTDTFRGTGVFNAIQFEREDKDDKTEPPSTTGNAPQRQESQKEKETVPK